jgi:16S rRNA (uracil1498-N3)-methyltransferase
LIFLATMANRKNKRQPRDTGPGRSAEDSSRKPSKPVSMDRYAAKGDPPLQTAFRLTLQEPFALERALVERLVLRGINAKEAFTIRDASGDYFRASLKELHRERGVALPYERMKRDPEPTLDITLACAVLARQRMLFVMQKATELGVTQIVPLITDHSVPPEGLEHEKAASWPAQLLRAARQCRRGSIPHLHPPSSLDAFLTSPTFTSADLCVVLDDRSDPTLAPKGPMRHIVLFVGPEGGFSDAERLKLEGKARQWVLGGRVLRAETAVLVGLTAVQMTWGDFADAASFSPCRG